MHKFSTEAKVGLFILMGLAILVYMSMRVGGLSLGRDEGYALSVLVPSAAGLDEEASVIIAGVKVGRVTEIRLEDSKARLILRIKPGVMVGTDFAASLKTKGLLGERYLDLEPGEPGAPALTDGDEIKNVKTFTDIEELLTIIGGVAEDLKKVSATLSAALGDDEGRESVENIVKNIETLSADLKNLVGDNSEKFTEMVENLQAFSTSAKEVADNLNGIIDDNRDNLDDSIARFKDASNKLNETLDSINNITAKIDSGEGTIGKLIHDDATHDKINKALSGITGFMDRAEQMRFYLGYRAEYITESTNTKSYLSLRIQPKKDKYYLVEVVDDPRGYTKTETITLVPGGTTEIITTKDQIKISVQIAKRFHDLVVRGGLIESTGGLGIEYLLFDDMLRVYLEAFDFDEERDPHLKTGLTLHFNKYFYLTAGYDDFASELDLESAFVGLGFRFEDDDIKYLLSGAPAAL